MNKVKASISNEITSDNGVIYPSIRNLARKLGLDKGTISGAFKRNDGVFRYEGHSYWLTDQTDVDEKEKEEKEEITKEYEEFLKYKDVNEIPFKKFDFKFSKIREGNRYAIALFSDAHIEETVTPDSVLGLNEYNVNIARKRIEKYFVNLANCLNEDEVKDLIFASLGDTISGFIHDELAQTNGLTPLEAVEEAQNLIYNGLRYLCENTDLESIKFIGIVGNHSRTTKKIQHNNGYAMSYEWLMYRNIKKQCELTGLPIEFSIPNSEMAIVDTDDNRRFIFIHGFQIKSSGNGTVCGIYPALNRLSMKWDKTFHQDKIYLGHFHSCISIPNATVNGSIIGYNSFALTNGFQYEEPAQMYELFDSKSGLLLTRQIYCR